MKIQKGVIKRNKTKNGRQYNGQKKPKNNRQYNGKQRTDITQWSSKHRAEKYIVINMNPIKTHRMNPGHHEG